MRKSSYLFLLLFGLCPAIVIRTMNRISEAYESEHGFPPEGKGFFGIVALGIRGMLFFAIVAFICAVVAYRRTPGPKPVLRQVELALFCMPAIVTIAFAVLIVPRWPGAVYVLTGISL